MRKLLFLSALLFIFGQQKANAQVCQITITPMDTTICPGDSVFISANANLLNNNQYFDFNGGALPSGWNAAGGNAFSEPCGVNPTGTPYYWASTVSAGNPPGITTAGFDVTCGGIISFDMVFAIQSGTAPCEGPDLIGEGVELQYSIDGGLTWIPIIYYNPNGTTQGSQSAATGGSVGVGQTTPFTSWGTYTITIPPGALTSNTMFQWIQYTNSGTCCDNWGLDNIIINATGIPCGSTSVVNWSTGLMDTTSFYMTPTADTAFVAYVYDTLGNYMCTSDTVYVYISDGNFTYNLVDTANVYCPYDSVLAEVLNISNALEPMTYNWSNGSTSSSSYLSGAGVVPDTLIYYVDISDACGFTDYDSVVVLVDQILSIDSLTTIPQVNCTDNGMALAYVSGITGIPTYSWTGPGNPGPNNSNTLAMNNVPSGWYYFTITDNVCSASDSVYIDNVIIDSVTYDLPDTVYTYCPFDSAFAEVLNIQFADAPISYGWYNENGDTISTTSSAYLLAGSLQQDEIWYYMEFTDFCGFTRYDSVLLVVNQNLTIDSLIQTPTTTCQPDGSVEAFVSGVMDTITPTIDLTYLWENEANWNSPGNGDSINTSDWNNIGSGWYYFTVVDDACSVTDSIFVDMLNPPIADITAVPDYGCAPLSVTLVNNSQNTSYYEWDLGDGNIIPVHGEGSQFMIYNESSTVTIMAYLDSTMTCGNGASLAITIPICGCTDPTAENYNPDAVVDDGGCFYPTPIVVAPNVFTPNNDGENDFYFVEVQNVVTMEFIILNRWGNVMYEQTIDYASGVPQIGWTGTTKLGANAEEGTYFYKYVATGINGDEIEGHGFIQLVRD